MLACRTTPVRGSSASTRTPTSIEVRQAALTVAVNVTSWPILIGTRNDMRSMLAVTVRRRECRTEAMPAASSTSFMIVPPWMSRLALASAIPIHCASTVVDSDGALASTIRNVRWLGLFACPSAAIRLAVRSDPFQGGCDAGPDRAHVDSRQSEDLQDARQGRGSGRDARLQLPEAARAASERQEGHRRRRHRQEAHPGPGVEPPAAGRQARHAGASGAGRRAARISPAPRSSART